MNSTLVCAHNPMTGPRHLGHYVSTMADWQQLGMDHELFIVVDDLIAAILYPRARAQLQARTLQTVREFMATGLDFSQHHIVLTSMLPEAHELSLYAAMLFDRPWCDRLYRESFAGLLTSYQRHELRLGHHASMAEVVYPQIHLAALTLGLQADFFHGGEEMRGYMQILATIAEQLADGCFRTPAFIPGGTTFMIGVDGNHMASENAIYLSSDPAEISRQVEKIPNAAILRRMMLALEGELGLKLEQQPDAADFAEQRQRFAAALIQLLRPYREATNGVEEIGGLLERSAMAARARMQDSLITIKRSLQLTGYNYPQGRASARS